MSCQSTVSPVSYTHLDVYKRQLLALLERAHRRKDPAGPVADLSLSLIHIYAHDWNDVQVEFFGQHFRTCGGVVQGIERMIPLCWNKKVQVVRDE